MKTETKKRPKIDFLLQQGLELFLQTGYHGTSIQDVLDSAGIPKGSFYSYFKSKEDFAAQVVKHYIDQFVPLLVVALNDQGRPALERLIGFFDGVTDLYKEKHYSEGCLVGNFGAEISDTIALCREALAEGARAVSGHYAQLIQQGQADGSIRNDIASEMLADFVYNSWEGCILRMKIDKHSSPLEDTKSLLRTFLEPKSLRLLNK